MSSDATTDGQTITLDGNDFIVAGRLPGFTKRTIGDHIKSHGGTHWWELHGDSSDVIALVGANPSRKLMDKILANGLTIVKDEALEVLLTTGEVVLEVEAGESLDELIGAARSLLAETPSPQSWQGIVALVDRCSPAFLEALVAYLEPQLARWPIETSGQLSYYGAMTIGELRVAPREWLAAILAGDKSPKYRLVYGVNLGLLKLKDTLAIKLFETDQLPNWRHFDIGESYSSSWRRKGFFTALADAKNIENIESLVVRRLKEHDGAIAKIYSMPNIKYLVLQNAPTEALTGPWAPNIEALYVDADLLSDLLKEVTRYENLRELSIAHHSYRDLDVDKAFAPSALWGALDTVRVQEGSTPSLRALCGRLGEGGSIKTLDLRHCALDIRGEQGVALLDEVLVQSGVIDSLERVITSPLFDVDALTMLEALDIEVLDPEGQPLEITEESGEESWTPFALASGEEERRQKGALDVTDALLYEEPGNDAWQVVIGVADGLREQLVPEEFDAAMARLAEALETWPTHMRPLPLHWAGLLDNPARDARLDLVTTLDLGRAAIDDQARLAAASIKRLATTPHIDTFEHVILPRYNASKTTLSACGELLDAAQPSSVALGSYYKSKDREQAQAFLKERGIEPYTSQWTYSQPIKAETLSEELAQRRHLKITLENAEDLLTLLGTADMDHVVSLKLSVGIYFNPSEIPFEIPEELDKHTVSASWKHLRRLEIEINGMPSEARLEPFARLADAFATWVADARPVVVAPALNPTAADVVLSHKLVEHGVYGRAYGSQFDVHFVQSPEVWRATLGREDLRVRMLRFTSSGWMRAQLSGGERVGRLRVLADAMHPNLRKHLKVLRAPLSLEDLDELEDLAQLFPSLGVWCAANNFYPDHITNLLEALANAPSTASLGAFIPAFGSSSKPLSKKEQAVLDKGDGLPSEKYMNPQTKYSGSIILSNYL